MPKINFKTVESRRKKESWAEIAGDLGVSQSTLKRQYYAWKKRKEAAVVQQEQEAPKPKKETKPKAEPKAEPVEAEKPETGEAEKPQKTVTTQMDDYNAEWPSYQLIPLVEAIASVNTILQVGQRKTTVFVKHPEHRKQVMTFFGSLTAPGLISPWLKSADGAKPDTLGLMTVKLKGKTPDEIAELGYTLLKRAGLAA